MFGATYAAGAWTVVLLNRLRAGRYLQAKGMEMATGMDVGGDKDLSEASDEEVEQAKEQANEMLEQMFSDNKGK